MNPWAFITVIVFSFYAFGVYAKKPDGEPVQRINLEPQDDAPDGSSVWDYSSAVNPANIPSRHPKRFSRRRQFRQLKPLVAPQADEKWPRNHPDFQPNTRPTGDARLPDIDYAQRPPTQDSQRFYDLNPTTRETLSSAVKSTKHDIRINGKQFSIVRNGDIIKNYNPASLRAQDA